MKSLFERSRVEFSPDRKYRYYLMREWNAPLGRCVFVMLNPSTADEVKNDPTVERCQRRCVAMGFGSLVVVNIFGLRSTDPKALYEARDPVGRSNDEWISIAIRFANQIVCAWGKHGILKNRGQEVLALIRKAGKIPHALKINSDGTPAHPLYIGYDVKPLPLPTEEAQ